MENKPIKLKNLAVRMKKAFLQLWLLVLALTVGMGALSYIRGQRSFVPMYEASAVFTVEAGYTTDAIFSNNLYYDQYAARQLAATFQQIIPMDVMRDLIVQEIPKGYINGYATATAVAESNLIILRVTSNDPQDAYDYLSAIIHCYPQVAIYVASNPVLNIMQSAIVPTEPYNYFDGAYAAARGGIIGLAAGLALVMLYALLTRTVQTADELKSTLNLPLIVALPKVTLKRRRKKTASGLITSESDPNMAESLRGLRVKMKKLLDSPEKKVTLVTSTIAGEGKTTVAINLAHALVSDGHRVLLLDADLRSQSVSRAMGEKATGHNLLDWLRDPEIPVETMIRTNEALKLDFISGHSTDERHYTVSIHALTQLLEGLKRRYDYIIMDTAPCEVISDTASLCRCADCVLYVVRQDHAQSSQILNAVTALHQKDVTITGCIFNGVPQSHHKYGYSHGYSYGYRKYGYGYSYRTYGAYSRYTKKNNID